MNKAEALEELISKSPKNRRNYENLRRFFDREDIEQNPSLLRLTPETVESNVQWLTERGINYRHLLQTSVKNKRTKILFLLQQNFNYHPDTTAEQKRDAIRKAYEAIRKEPHLLSMSEEGLRSNSWKYLILGGLR